ncbi:MAG: two-component response regulator [Bradyrhizobium sp.]|nr:two-component response regulator [Bradyrhizobium sp.]
MPVGWLSGDSSLADLLVVLVVEDDPLIQTLIDQALSDGGYEPVMVASGEEAVMLLQGNSQHYRALVSDINLKGTIDGWDVARQAREINPSFPIVYMTGAAAEQWASQGVPNSILLSKPFAPAQLVTAISQLLNAGSQPTAPTS